MLDGFGMAVRTLEGHVGAATWAMAVFAAGFGLAFPVVRLEVKSLLLIPTWVARLAKKYLTPDVSPVFLCAFIFGFNAVAIFCYMVSGGLLFLPIVFDLFTGLNVGAVMVRNMREPEEEELTGPLPPVRAWVGFLGLFVIVVELSSLWLAIGMGITLGHAMRAGFGWATFVEAARPRILAYVLIIVPALAASAAAETAAVKAMFRRQ